MFVVQAVDRSRRWISGVFGSQEAADAYLALIPEDARPKHSVVEVAGASYPLYICEDERGFRFLNEAEVIAEVGEVPDGCPTLIGQLPLEALDFVVDPHGQKLIGNPDHGGEQMVDLFGLFP